MKQYKKKGWIRALCQVNRGQTRYGIAPHKPILLLSLLDAFDKGVVSSNKIFLSLEILAHFFDNWQKYVNTGNISDITQPIFYLQNDQIDGEKWWFVKAKNGFNFNKPIKSFEKLRLIVDHIYLHDDLFLHLSNSDFRRTARLELINCFFPSFDKQSMLTGFGKDSKYIDKLKEEMLNPDYGKAEIGLQVQKEQEKFIRGELFKKVVPEIYNYRCAFSGWGLRSRYNQSMVEACHIVPFSESRIDDVRNGISLCPNMHAAFDRGFVTVDENYKLVISKQFDEDKKNPFALSQFEGSKILLPSNPEWWPSQDYLKKHREKFLE